MEIDYVGIVRIIALLCSVAGAYYTSNLKKRGYVVWAVADMIWFVDAVFRNDIQQCILWMYFIIMSFYGAYNVYKRVKVPVIT